jgi:hypothetical protein
MLALACLIGVLAIAPAALAQGILTSLGIQ